jgi:hypothetical protein
MEGQHQQWGCIGGCDQSKHTFNYYSAEHMRIYGSGFIENGSAVPV